MKNYTQNEIKENVTNDYRWLARAIVAIYNRQTEDEQNTDSTRHLNGIGFNGVDAEILSSFAKQINKGRILSDKQKAIAVKKMGKYAGQLYRIQSA